LIKCIYEPFVFRIFGPRVRYKNFDHAGLLKRYLATILGGIAPVCGNFTPIIVTTPAQAVRLRMRMRNANPGFTLLSTGALSAGDVVAVAPNILVSAVSPTVSFEASRQGVVHRDTVPLPIVDGGSTPAPNSISLWQCDAIAIKMRYGASFGLRSATGVSWLASTVW
jgi:hypothetical protein